MISTPGGETVDSCVVWLPEHRMCFVSNTFGPLFPHFPNLNTLRGDRYRFVEPYLATVQTVRALRHELLVVGRYLPIEGTELIDASLGRLHDAVDRVHRDTLRGMNEGKDLYTLMREVTLPDELRVGQGYGTVRWAVRTIVESYAGWFQRRSTTELYASPYWEVSPDLVELAGAAKIVDRARVRLDGGDPIVALHLLEAVLAAAPEHPEAREVAIDAHRALLGQGDERNFWASGWIRHEIDRLTDGRSATDEAS